MSLEFCNGASLSVHYEKSRELMSPLSQAMVTLDLLAYFLVDGVAHDTIFDVALLLWLRAK
jgi:hypothetical protein